MARQSNFPMLLDEAKRVEIRFLKQHRYLIPGQDKSGVITWSRNGVKTSSISIRVNTVENYLELDYSANGEPIKYRVKLIRKTANIGNGVLWYFECPRTHLLCRSLYYSFPYFLHRKAHKGSMYTLQTFSADTRAKAKIIDNFHAVNENYSLIRSKHFRTHYKGKPTKRYMRAMNAIKKGERISLRMYEMAFLV